MFVLKMILIDQNQNYYYIVFCQYIYFSSFHLQLIRVFKILIKKEKSKHVNNFITMNIRWENKSTIIKNVLSF